MTADSDLDTRSSTASHRRIPRWPFAAVADLVAVVVFVAIGRRSHAESSGVAGVVQTSWPFVAGALIGWLVSRGWRAATTLRPTGLAVWLACVAAGMVLRAVSGQGVAASFVVVATLVLGAFLLGWRAVVPIVRRSGPR